MVRTTCLLWASGTLLSVPVSRRMPLVVEGAFSVDRELCSKLEFSPKRVYVMELSLDRILAILGVVGIFVGLGVSIAMDPKSKGEMGFSVGCFVFSGLILCLTVGVLSFQNNGRLVARLLLSGVVFAAICASTVEASKWATKRYNEVLAESKRVQSAKVEEPSSKTPEVKPEPKPQPRIYGNKYAQMSSPELSASAIFVAQKIGKLSADCMAASDRVTAEFHGNASKLSEEQRQDAWNKMTEGVVQSSARCLYEYNSKYKTDALVIREELQFRALPGLSGLDTFSYEHPTNPLGMESIADDLEKLAKNLPTGSPD